MSVNLDKETWFCHHCGYKGGLSKIKEIVYKVPEWKNNTTLSDATVKYFEETTDGSLRFPKVINIDRASYE